MALGILLGTVYPAQAGLITVTVDIGSEASITFFNPTDNRNVTVSRRDVNRDGKITFGLGTLEREKKIDTVYVCKESDGEKTYGELKLDANGNTLASLEPFNFPSFTGQTTLVASIDMAAFLAGGNPFTIGQVLTVNDGIGESSTIIFKDGSSLPDNPDWSRALVASLPNFTGSVTVFSFDHAAATPEQSSTLILLGMGVLGLVMARWFEQRHKGVSYGRFHEGKT